MVADASAKPDHKFQAFLQKILALRVISRGMSEPGVIEMMGEPTRSYHYVTANGRVRGLLTYNDKDGAGGHYAGAVTRILVVDGKLSSWSTIYND